jgi:DNA-3-methyladenine glycosylase
MLMPEYFDRDACDLAKHLLGKVIRHKVQRHWLVARIIETEAYYLHERGSHASLGFTEKRKALFMPPGTIYMYYARGGDSLNVSCRGEGNAVLIKSALALMDDMTPAALRLMHALNPAASGESRKTEKLCSGQTLLCKSLGLKVTQWDQQSFDAHKFFIEDAGYAPQRIIQTTRLGIPSGRDEHLPYRFIELDYADVCTSNPLRKRGWNEGREYNLIKC